MKLFFVLAVTLVSIVACTQNSNPRAVSANEIQVGGSCEGCQAIHESPVPFDSLKSSTWLPDWNEKGKKLAVSGVVYKADGTPASNIIRDVYHTDQTGRYPSRRDEKGWGRRHGYVRGGMKTERYGGYQLCALRPA